MPKKSGFEVLGFLFAIILLIPYSMLMNGWAITKLWGWFIVPFGLPALTIPMALGIFTFVTYMTYRIDFAEAKADAAKGIGHVLVKSFTVSTFKPLTAILMGWIIHLFM